jgi:IclR family acetate operon transcriptional repressor
MIVAMKAPTAQVDQPEAKTGSLARGLQIVEVLQEASTPLGLADIAEATGLDNSTVFRLLQVLVRSGYAVRDSSSKRYMIGPKSIAPLPMYHPINELRREISGTLVSMQRRFGGTTGLVLFAQHERLIVEFARGPESLAPFYATWLSSPLHASASGKVLLSSLPSAERAKLLGPAPFERFTPATLTDLDALESDLAAGIERGYAIASDDYFAGLTAIGAPINSLKGRIVGCLAHVDRTARSNEQGFDAIGSALKQEADLASHTVPSLWNVVQVLSG